MSHYDNILFFGDLNSQPSENCVNDFCNVYDLSNGVKEPTCFKNPDNLPYIDFFFSKPFKMSSNHYNNENRDLIF